MRKYLLFLILVVVYALNGCAQAVPKDIRVHDPVSIKQDSTYYIFATGEGCAVQT